MTAMRRGAPEEMVSARTDAEGRVRLAIGEADEWRISAVHMVRDGESEDFEWRSWWASVTFHL